MSVRLAAVSTRGTWSRPTLAGILFWSDQLTAVDTEKFLREARAPRSSTPNIVNVHEVGRDGDTVYIVSDFVKGTTLGDWLTGKRAAYQWAEAGSLF